MWRACRLVLKKAVSVPLAIGLLLGLVAGVFIGQMLSVEGVRLWHREVELEDIIKEKFDLDTSEEYYDWRCTNTSAVECLASIVTSPDYPRIRHMAIWDLGIAAYAQGRSEEVVCFLIRLSDCHRSPLGRPPGWRWDVFEMTEHVCSFLATWGLPPGKGASVWCWAYGASADERILEVLDGNYSLSPVLIEPGLGATEDALPERLNAILEELSKYDDDEMSALWRKSPCGSW